MDGAQQWERHNGPVHKHFGLTYAEYMVLPRVMLHSMPLDWQERFVAILREYHEHFAAVGIPDFHIQTVEWCDPAQMTDDQRQRAGVTVVWPGEDDDEDAMPLYYHRGSEVEGGFSTIPLPVENPLPHYKRGFVDPADLPPELRKRDPLAG
jgi:hypothetical protein